MNLGVLPDKGERLKTQVKELEDALESLSLTAASQPGMFLFYSFFFSTVIKTLPDPYSRMLSFLHHSVLNKK